MVLSYYGFTNFDRHFLDLFMVLNTGTLVNLNWLDVNLLNELNHQCWLYIINTHEILTD